MSKTEEQIANENFANYIAETSSNGKLVINTIEGLSTISCEDFIKQPTIGILYDLNRDTATTMALIRGTDEHLPKVRLVNDYAVAMVIAALKNKITKLETINA